MLNLNDTTLICPQNDLESVTILEIARRLGVNDIRPVDAPWGAWLDGPEFLGPTPGLLRDLKKNVVIVELPGPETEPLLRELGHTVFAIDHHHYSRPGRSLLRNRPESSLEQFARLAGYPLNREERLIALNDRGSYYAMARESDASLEEMVGVRMREMEVLGHGEDHLCAAREALAGTVDFNASTPLHFSLLVTSLDRSMTMPIAEVYQKPGAEEIAQWRSDGKPIPVKAILILTTDADESKVVGIDFFGPWHFKERLQGIAELHGLDPAAFNVWQGGTEGLSCFWGARPGGSADGRDCSALADAVLNELVVHDRPILKFSTVFFYPFQFKEKEGDGHGPRSEASSAREAAAGTGDSAGDAGPERRGLWERKQLDINNASRYQEYIYFHPYVRDLIYRTPGREREERLAVTYYEFPLPENTRMTIHRDSDGDNDPLEYPLDHVAIHTFFNGVAILALQVTQEFPDKAAPFWKLCRRMEEFRSLKLTYKDTMQFNEIARRIYPSFPEQTSENKIPLCVEIRLSEDEPHRRLYHDFRCNNPFLQGVNPMNLVPISNVVTWLVGEFLGGGGSAGIAGGDVAGNAAGPGGEGAGEYGAPKAGGGRGGGGGCGSGNRSLLEDLWQGRKVDFLGVLEANSHRSILDDRMVVHTFFALAGTIPRGEKSLDDHKALFYRIFYVDQLEEGGYAYDKDFIVELGKPLIYTRWLNYGNLYGFTRFSSAYTGFGDFVAWKLFNDFSRMYYQLAIISLYYRCVLIKMSDDVAVATRDLVVESGRTLEKADRERFLKLKGEFMRFSNVFWFQEVTNQDQGIEIFDLYKKSFQFEAMYKQIMREIDRADEYLETYYRLELDDLSRLAAAAGLSIGFAAMVTGFFGMNFLRLGDTGWGKHNWLFGTVLGIILMLVAWLGAAVFRNDYIRARFREWKERRILGPSDRL